MLLVEKIKASETEHQKLFAQHFLVLIYNFSPKPRQSSAKFFTLTKKLFLSVVSSSLSLGKRQYYQPQQPRASHAGVPCTGQHEGDTGSHALLIGKLCWSVLSLL